MNCKHATVKGNTTKYFYCNLKDQAVDDYKCRDCMMKLPDLQKVLKKYLERDLGNERCWII